VTDWSAIFLGIIALAVSVMAAIQVGIVVYGARLARRVDALAIEVDREIKPLLTHLNAIGEEAARATTLAAAQVERVDRLFADVSLRVEETATAVQSAIVAPAREGLAVLTGVRAAIDAFKSMRQANTPAPSATPDEDDPLFIG
jgi:Zn-dependent alcohol dehydrogenase